MTIRIAGTGSAFPKTVVTNDDLAKVMDTSDEWISSRTGIKERRIAKDETTAGMAAEAARAALKDAGMTAQEVDLIIVGTLSADHFTPSCACEIQAELGAVNAVAFDINAACSGFMFSLHTAYAYLQSGLYKNALVLGAETLSKIMDWEDRSTCVLFGDGAGAVVVRREEEGIFVFDQGSDGVKGKVLSCKARLVNNLLVQQGHEPDYVHMDGQEVYKFAVSTVPASINKVLEKAGVSADEVAYFVLHQANIRILQSVAKRLKVSEDKFPIILDRSGNVSAATVPLLLDDMNKKGMLKRGDKIVLSGFGGGLTWGTALIEW
ncbi:MAG: ketoacyl-ACP synthase III [Lachnospiraceae bacterium]|nr:ketoacyl-ACP synthase III [Lachnospiraceae bacterium]